MPNGLKTDLPEWLPSLSHEVLASAVHALGEGHWVLVGALARDYAFRNSEDVLAASSQIVLPGSISVRIATAPAVGFLKIVAWHDNRAGRERDLEDIAALIRGYITEIVGWDDAFASYEPVMTADDFDLDEAGAYVLGCQIALLLSEEVHEKTLDIVSDIAQSDGPFAVGLQRYLKTSPEQSERVCHQLLKGLRGDS